MTAKQAARELTDRLPDNVSWNDLMYELYMKEKIEEGLKDIVTVIHGSRDLSSPANQPWEES